MDDQRFDHWTRSLQAFGSRRTVTNLLAGGTFGALLAHFGGEDVAARQRKTKHKKKPKPRPKPNKYGCLEVGDRCKRASQCCSSKCEGKKGKKTCRAHGTGTCDQTQRGYCTAADPEATACNDTENCYCLETTAGSTFCGPVTSPGVACAGCRKDADCERIGFPPGSACIPLSIGRCSEACVGGMACMAPCGSALPEP